MKKYIIEINTKRLRYTMDTSKCMGIYQYIYQDGQEISDNHEIIETDNENYMGMYLPKWINNDWVEDATEEEINKIKESKNQLLNKFKKPKSEYPDSITSIQLALTELYQSQLQLQEQLHQLMQEESV